MSLKLLKQIIAHLRKQSNCPFCSGKFNEDFIFVLATTLVLGSNNASALFLIVCPTRSAHAIIMAEVTMKYTAENSEKQEIHIETKSATRDISINEVLDMHNFLKGWDGDLKELFKEL